MDQAASDVARESDPREQIASALGSGVIFVDSDGHIVWIDQGMRRRLNGGMEDLVLPVQKAGTSAIDCFVSAVPLKLDGKEAMVCVIQENRAPDRDLISAIESVLVDTSSFARSVMDRLKGLRQAAKPEATDPAEASLDVDLLTHREREVLGLICEGHSDLEMSKKLNLSENTVRNHIASLYRKIGVNRRSAAIIWARERAITSQANLSLKQRTRRSADSLER
jgi:DNA-binding CsgD family transcriptional regulator